MLPFVLQSVSPLFFPSLIVALSFSTSLHVFIFCSERELFERLIATYCTSRPAGQYRKRQSEIRSKCSRGPVNRLGLGVKKKIRGGLRDGRRCREYRHEGRNVEREGEQK